VVYALKSSYETAGAPLLRLLHGTSKEYTKVAVTVQGPCLPCSSSSNQSSPACSTEQEGRQQRRR
jgi:hypothetical protein